MIKPERLDVITAAHLTLGYIYYELGFYPEAIKHYAEISSDDPTYPEALLARSWAAIKLNDYQQAIITLNELIKNTQEAKYIEEAHFLLGQCYLQLGFYDFAITEYDYIIQQYPSQDGLESRLEEVETGIFEQKKQAEKLRLDLLVLESKLLDMIPLENRQAIPKYLQEELQRIDESRNNLIQNILRERNMFDEFQWAILRMREDIAMKRSRRHWRAYAEFGKARAFFLKTLPGR